MFQAEIPRGGREDRLRADEDFLAARHRAAHIVFADERRNSDAGFAGDSGLRAAAGGAGVCAGLDSAAETAVPTQDSDFGLAGEEKKRPAISAAIAEGCGTSFAAGIAGAGFGAPLPRTIPCPASTVSTMRAIVARSTPAADAGTAGSTTFFSCSPAFGEGAGACSEAAGSCRLGFA